MIIIIIIIMVNNNSIIIFYIIYSIAYYNCYSFAENMMKTHKIIGKRMAFIFPYFSKKFSLFIF